MNSVLFSSNSDEWATPQNVFDELNNEFGFNLDPCASAENAKCPKFFTKEDDGLAQNWGGTGHSLTRPIQKLVNGFQKHFTKAEKITRLWFYLFQREPTPDIFTTS